MTKINHTRINLIKEIKTNGYIVYNNIAIDYSDKEGLFIIGLKSFKCNEIIFEDEPYYQTFSESKYKYKYCNICYKEKVNGSLLCKHCEELYPNGMKELINKNEEYLHQTSMEYNIYKYGTDSIETKLVRSVITKNDIPDLKISDEKNELLGLMISELLDIHNNIESNKFGIFENNDNKKVIGTAYFPYICFMNHSCEPNTKFNHRFFGKRSVIANRDIEKFEKITLNYIETDVSQYKRREKLLKNYGTSCYCDICLTCFYCESKLKLKNCNKCKIALYCSKECQIADWKNHKKDCKC